MSKEHHGMELSVGRAAEFPNGSMRSVAVGEKRIVVFRDDSGNFSALEDRCSHADVRLSTGKFKVCQGGGGEVECPAHGARFDVRSGKALCMPAVSPVRQFEVSLSIEGNVMVRVP